MGTGRKEKREEVRGGERKVEGKKEREGREGKEGDPYYWFTPPCSTS